MYAHVALSVGLVTCPADLSTQSTLEHQAPIHNPAPKLHLISTMLVVAQQPLRLPVQLLRLPVQLLHPPA